ncbi:prepilin peptidase [Paraburkholderia sp. GAS32]|uniref:prepilin peptidase n=1 Tax=Paraburkholderia sp. GAS32 TaxID=3035129 RepID=UPI003D203C40
MKNSLVAISVFFAAAVGLFMPRAGQIIAQNVMLEPGEALRSVHVEARHYLTMAACAALSNGLCLMAFGLTWVAAVAFLFCGVLLVSALVDHWHNLLPDVVTLTLLWIGLLVSVGHAFASPVDAILGAVAGYVGLRTVSIGAAVATGRDGIGGGDFKLLAAIGAWLGWQVLLPVVLISSVVAVAHGLWLKRGGKGHENLAYGPGLTLGALVMLFSNPLIF